MGWSLHWLVKKIHNLQKGYNTTTKEDYSGTSSRKSYLSTNNTRANKVLSKSVNYPQNVAIIKRKEYLKKKNLLTNALYIISRNFQRYNYLSEGNLNGKLKF